MSDREKIVHALNATKTEFLDGTAFGANWITAIGAIYTFDAAGALVTIGAAHGVADGA